MVGGLDRSLHRPVTVMRRPVHVRPRERMPHEMIEYDSIVFEKIDYFMIWVLLITRQKRILARYFVQLDPENPKSEEEILTLFERRLAPIQ